MADARGRAALVQAGGVIGTVAGDVVTAEIPVGALSTLASAPGIGFIEAAAWLPVPAPLHSAASPARGQTGAEDSRFDILRQRFGNRFEGATGEGVIIGVYDSGLDVDHPDFQRPEGGTRVLFAWDQTASDGAPPGQVGPHGFDYGTECNGAAIDAAAPGCRITDQNGHGTHVTGIAAGTGAATGNGLPPWRHVGAAPAADLIVVKGGDSGYSGDRVLDGVAYIFERAAQLGRPAVVNLSLGTQSGPHDGSTLFERGLENLLGPGRVIVASAGNQGNNRTESPPFARQWLHAQGDVDDGAVEHVLDIPSYAPQAGAVNDAAVLELWHDAQVGVTVTILSPGGVEVARVAPGDSVIALSADGAVYVDNTGSGAPANDGGGRLVLITVFDADAAQPPRPGVWRVRTERTSGTGSGVHHVWLVGSNLGSGFDLSTLAGETVSNTHLIALPGSAGRLIAVASHTARVTWDGPGGGAVEFPFRETIGDLSHFSSPGPRTDGVLKPELAAPGKAIVSARSSDATLWDGLPDFIEADGMHAVLFGTSMSTPFVTGATALLLQYAPSLGPEEVRALLQAGARQDAFTARSYSELSPEVHWGAGKLDAPQALHGLGLPAGTFAVSAAPVQDESAAAARIGARIPLLTLELSADSVEAIHVAELRVGTTGVSSESHIVVVADTDGDGAIDDDEPLHARAPASDGAGTVAVETDAVVAAGRSARYLIGIEIGAAVANATSLGAFVDLASSRFVGTLSGAVNRWQDAPGVVASGPRPTTVLADGRRWSLSENPVRSGRLVLNYAEAPRAIRVYTLDGGLVRDLPVDGSGAGRVEWSLDNQRGAEVTSGLYLLYLDFPGERVVERLIVLRSR